MQKPSWLKTKIPSGEKYFSLKKILKENKIFTVCEEAKCPNIGECWNRNTLTFLILGDICTRHCKFCNVKKDIPSEVDKDEPKRLARIVKKLNVKHVIITSVTRDDLEDGGATIFCETLRELRKINSKIVVEFLIPDFNGNLNSLNNVFNENPDILGHNLEVPENIYPKIGRERCLYNRSLNILKKAKENELTTKSGIMVGIGETINDIIKTFRDLNSINCDFLVIGQYLSPSIGHIKVEKYYSPEEFETLKEIAMRYGFKNVISHPLARSSYRADELFRDVRYRQ
ncbi:MAG: lipoyl synthase [Acidobacteriota bacterium]